MPHVLVTGAGGYIGSVLTRLLLQSGHEVTAVDRFFFGQEALVDLTEIGALFVQRKDIRDLSVEDFSGIDCVFDLAALSNDPAGDLDPTLTEQINYLGRVHVASCAKKAGVPKYVLSSSCSVYGTGGIGQLLETASVGPLTAYAKANLQAENGTRELADDTFCWTAFRNATVYGLSPRMRFDLVVNLMTLNAVQDGKIIVMGGGRQWRPLVHVSDVARAFIKLLDAQTEIINGQIFNIGMENYQVRGLAYAVREALPFPIEIEIAPDNADKRNYNVSFDKATRILGFTAQETLRVGIAEIYEALKMGRVEPTAKTSTVGWYKAILEADQLLADVRLNGRLI